MSGGSTVSVSLKSSVMAKLNAAVSGSGGKIVTGYSRDVATIQSAVDDLRLALSGAYLQAH